MSVAFGGDDVAALAERMGGELWEGGWLEGGVLRVAAPAASELSACWIDFAILGAT